MMTAFEQAEEARTDALAARHGEHDTPEPDCPRCDDPNACDHPNFQQIGPDDWRCLDCGWEDRA